MSDVQTNMPTTLVSSNLSPASGRNGAVTLRSCLVVSASTRRAEQFAEAAHGEHWAAIVCANAEQAARNAIRQRVQLALVDLESATAAQRTPFCKLVEQLARRYDGPLLAVCGSPNDEAAEVWSRGLGVWMYLPGINSQSDISLLYGQARRVVEKLEGASPLRAHATNGTSGLNGTAHAAREQH